METQKKSLKESTISRYFAVDRKEKSVERSDSEKVVRKPPPNKYFENELFSQCSIEKKSTSVVDEPNNSDVANISFIELDESACEKLATCGGNGNHSVECNNNVCANKVLLSMTQHFFFTAVFMSTWISFIDQTAGTRQHCTDKEIE